MNDRLQDQQQTAAPKHQNKKQQRRQLGSPVPVLRFASQVFGELPLPHLHTCLELRKRIKAPYRLCCISFKEPHGLASFSCSSLFSSVSQRSIRNPCGLLSLRLTLRTRPLVTRLRVVTDVLRISFSVA